MRHHKQRQMLLKKKAKLRIFVVEFTKLTLFFDEVSQINSHIVFHTYSVQRRPVLIDNLQNRTFPTSNFYLPPLLPSICNSITMKRNLHPPFRKINPGRLRKLVVAKTYASDATITSILNGHKSRHSSTIVDDIFRLDQLRSSNHIFTSSLTLKNTKKNPHL